MTEQDTKKRDQAEQAKKTAPEWVKSMVELYLAHHERRARQGQLHRV